MIFLETTICTVISATKLIYSLLILKQANTFKSSEESSTLFQIWWANLEVFLAQLV